MRQAENRIRRVNIREERGATVVEFALVASLLFIILFAIFEFGLIFLQEHFVASAAREGVRIGIRANNFDAFTPLTGNTTDGCNRSSTDRAWMVDCQMRDYLETLYDRTDAKTTVTRTPATPDGNPATLEVSVETPNFYPPILSGLIKMIPGGSFDAPQTISHTARGDYEDLSEP